jgi:lipopolysaccharide export system protein LptA
MSAQRASAPVRLARLAAAVLMIALSVIVAVRLAGRRGGPLPEAVAPPPADRVVDVKERVRHQEFRDGRPVADIRGTSFFRGPDGRNHLEGSVEIVNLDPAGGTVSRLAADEVVYAPGSLRFTVSGRVRVEAGGVVLEGETFDYDKTAGLFGTTGGGRFASDAVRGRAAEISYRESAGEFRLGGGFRVEIGPKDRAGELLVFEGDAFTFERRGRRGRADGRAALEGAGFRGASAAVSFVTSPDESSLESAVLEGDATVSFGGPATPGGGSGEIRAERIVVAFAGGPSGPLSIETSGGSSLSMRSAADRAETVLAPAVALTLDRGSGRATWSASGGIRAGIAAADGASRTLEGAAAAFDAAGVLGVTGGSGRPAVADSADVRIEAPSISVATATGELSAWGGVAAVLRGGEGRRPVGFFAPREDVSVSSERLVLRPEASASAFSGNVLARQGTDTLRAEEIELSGDTGRMSGRGGISVTLTGAADGRPGVRTVELRGQDMAYLPDTRTVILSSKASAGFREARLEAGTVSAVLAREGRGLESLTARTAVVVSKGRFEGRAEAAAYLADGERITLTGGPVLTDDKGGSARGSKLTFDLADDKILIENEGPGRATTVVRS